MERHENSQTLRRGHRVRYQGALALAGLTLLLATMDVRSVGAASTVITQSKTAGPYRLVLQIGPPEPTGMSGMQSATCKMKGMLTRAIDDIAHPSAAMKPCNHHVELHVSTGRSNTVVHTAHVTMTMTNTVTHTSVSVPVMTMGGGKDFHYGNNMYAPAGPYRVAVSVNGVKASFSVRL